ncbi:DUF1294 domain-containing protein [Streptococcus sobrinus]|uniref:DUF1294 domain-containing protein n=1 Tax=Streptococcus sobrinus TaxID=1310 RepID=A0ABN5LKP8_9STRE|nr:DUF1294 domain-containing protein [Streptococcus sobrinus]AWN18747.1 DUF1294 domain-containing protein [Streptococcus sobrinus]AWN20946.1 DUF1294 domain-containing protein [Streptococcus sobrinus]AWN61783.1 DUF1294 domain-containing protein [Streptococcus sobrinus]AWN63654.1 DUF1294 domain-containing protein [Streptococcus sobrinus]EMP70452.1 hypothetical protein D823_09417 [Streptococcus sobrinus DSM 20742 = ATCC 33478]
MKIFLSLLIFWNILTFCLYGLDKRRAIRGRWRIPEKTLLSLSLTGAGLAAYLAGRIFHHKTKKWYFKLAWCLGILIEVSLIYCLWRFKNEWTINF